MSIAEIRRPGWIALVVASAAMAWALGPDEDLAPLLPVWAVSAGIFVVAALVLGGLVRGAATNEPGVGSTRALPSAADLDAASPALMLAVAAALVPALLGRVAIGALAVLALDARARTDLFSARFDARGRGALDLHAVALFVLAGSFLPLYLAVALDMVGGRENDASYYFGVARWIAAHGRLEEPIVWHFLAPPRAIVHPAFDYWQGLTSLVLAGPLALFGRTHLVASWTMAVLSAASVVAFAYLVVVARPLASRPAQLGAIVAFALSPAMQAFRFDTETLVVFHLALIASLVALARGRVALGAALAFLVFLTRADGIVTCAILWLYALSLALQRWRAERSPRELARLVSTMLGVVAIYAASNVARFGAITPPGARRAPFLEAYTDLYAWTPTRASGSLDAWLARRFTFEALRDALHEVREAFETIDYVLENEFLLFVVPAGLVVFLRPRADPSGIHRASAAIALLGAVAIAWIGPVVFSAGRALHGLLPAMVIAAFSTLELPARWARRRLRARPRLARASFALLSSLCLVPTFVFARPYRPLAILRADFEAELASLDPLLRGENVATTTPWWVIANTESPAVLLPAQDEDAMAEVLTRYDVRWVLFTRDDAEGWGPSFWRAWAPYRDGIRSRIGPFRLERAHAGRHLVVYRAVRMR